MVSMNIKSKLIKNWDAVLVRFDMLLYISAWTSNVNYEMEEIQVDYHIKQHNLDKHQRNVDHNLSKSIGSWAIKWAGNVSRLPTS